MDDSEIIRDGLIELLIKLLQFDERQAEFARRARQNDTIEELLTQIRRWYKLQSDVADLLERAPDELKQFLQERNV